ncbi:MAG: hypothetical protein HY518_04175 [Candidatus Aenigmarchaeota archaeon]|nr:hypothetical protein [Candidatus Aenigmarchaeota archaeon]
MNGSILASGEITIAYAAKNMAPYLKITVPEPPEELTALCRKANRQAILYNVIESLYGLSVLFRPKRRRGLKGYREREEEDQKHAIAQSEKIDAEFEEYLRVNGLETVQEKGAWKIASGAGMCIKRLVRRGYKLETADIVEMGSRSVNEASVSPVLFEEYLQISLNDGIRCLEDDYWIPIVGVQKPQIVNQDFEENAARWLKDGVYSMIEGGDCRLLESVMVRKDGGKVRLKMDFGTRATG